MHIYLYSIINYFIKNEYIYKVHITSILCNKGIYFIRQEFRK